MRFSIRREELLRPLQLVGGIIERRHTQPILANALLDVDSQGLTLYATDLEVSITVAIVLQQAESGTATVPARKFLEIVRALPEQASIETALEGGRLRLHSGNSRFFLSTLPVEDFPRTDSPDVTVEVVMPQRELRRLLERTQFAMAHQDVRYYLNGLLLDFAGGRVRAVATDGHRLALCDRDLPTDLDEAGQIIVPRKAVLEVLRLAQDMDELVTLRIGPHQMEFRFKGLSFVTKLVDGRFPDYERVIPVGHDKLVVAEREQLRQVLLRTSILSSEQSHTVRLRIESGQMHVSAHNLEQDEAEEDLPVSYEGEELDIGFNVTYLLDVLGAMTEEQISLAFLDPGSSCLLCSPEDETCRYVVMPMRL